MKVVRIKNKVLDRKFFEKEADLVAPKLLGKIICRKIGNKILRVLITETEAYLGEKDMASHARFGKTKRNSVMYDPGGRWYIYFVYGMHWLLNITTQTEGVPSAVLVRGGILLGEKNIKIVGPAKLTATMKITGKLSGTESSKKSGFWIENEGIKINKILKSPRIGVDYSGIWSKKKLRFCLSKEEMGHLMDL